MRAISLATRQRLKAHQTFSSFKKTIKGGDVTSFTDTNLKEGTTYIYWIKSYRMDYQNKKIYSRSNDYSKSIVY